MDQEQIEVELFQDINPILEDFDEWIFEPISESIIEEWIQALEPTIE